MLRIRRYGPVLHLRPCAGVLCDVHEACARYHFVDGTSDPSAVWLATCAPLGAPHPGFIAIDFIGPPHPAHYALTRRDIVRTRRAPRSAVVAALLPPQLKELTP